MDLGLKGKVALVGGASKGLGKAVALGLAHEGARVAMISHDRGRIEAAAMEVREVSGAEALAISADLSRAEDIQRAVDETARRFGTIHILVTNTGGPPSGPFVSLTEEQWQSAVNGTLLMPVRLSQAVIPFMQKQKWGRIIHMASSSVKQPIEDLMLSNSIRSAVIGLGKTQALELAKDGILVNSVLPGWTKTERVDQLVQNRAKKNHTTPAEAAAAIEREIPLGRMGKPEEFANVVVFLASECASFVDGVALPVDGGNIRTPF